MTEQIVHHTHPPENRFIDAFNPPFWVASHLYDKNTYVIYRLVGGTIHKEIKVLITKSGLESVQKLSPEEKMYFKRKKLL